MRRAGPGQGPPQPSHGPGRSVPKANGFLPCHLVSIIATAHPCLPENTLRVAEWDGKRKRVEGTWLV